MIHLNIAFDSPVNSRHSGDDIAGFSVHEMQKVVIRWMSRQLNYLHWSAERWAREAGLAPTTVTRAMSSSYNSVSSVTTLHALARAANVPSVLDFLDGQRHLNLNRPVIGAILKELLPAVGCTPCDEKIAFLAEVMAATLIGLAEQDPQSSGDPEFARKLARAARAAIEHR